MKQIIPFKKELPFKTKVSEITSISLERELEIKEEGIISGVFHITGEYKMNEGSINREKYSFDLPFDITLDPRYDIETVSSDIEDFYYDVINEDTLKVNIDLYVEAEYLPVPTEEKIEEPLEVREEPEEKIEELPEIEQPVEEKDREEVDIMESDLFSNLNSEETYVTYYVYIVKEEDSLEKILTKYEITKEDFENYNDINNIKPGVKVIIPKKSE